MGARGELWGRGSRKGGAVILAGLFGLFGAGGACAGAPSGNGEGKKPEPEDPFARAREAMVATQIVARGVTDRCVLEAMRTVPRHRFVPEPERARAYDDGPLPIGHGQTISQPYIVAVMSELVRADRSKKILEVGTGSGYQAAILAECAGEVYTIEILPELGRQAERRLAELGYRNVHVRIGDGFDGWPEAAPFDGIVVTAAPDEIPGPLLAQLKVGGRLVIPVGEADQQLLVVTRTETGYLRESVLPVRFVPMTGKAQREP
jgi:protein-L-isoaspartate(D-aspartate) O-methyltransferase